MSEKKNLAVPNQTSENPCLLLQANIALLGADLVAAFENNASEYSILIKPTSTNANELSIQDMIDQVNKLVEKITGETGSLKSEDIESKLEGVLDSSSNDTLSDITICLKQLFLYIKRQKAPEKASENTMEYAIDVEIKNKIASDFTLINIHSVSLAVWNTHRQSILESMELQRLGDLLEKYSG